MGKMILQAKNINKSFSNGKTKLSVLRDFSLDAEAGQIITIMGQSGSGKTTALNILGTLDQFDSGELTISGRQVQSMNETELSKILMGFGSNCFINKQQGSIGMGIIKSTCTTSHKKR